MKKVISYAKKQKDVILFAIMLLGAFIEIAGFILSAVPFVGIGVILLISAILYSTIDSANVIITQN